MNTAAGELFRKLRAEGYGAFCASCERMHEAAGRGLPQCSAPSPCGSVLGGRDFVHYRGPFRAEHYCFVCGEPPIAEVGLLTGNLTQGLCETHLPMLRGVEFPIRVQRSGKVVLAEELLRDKPSKARAIYEEAERYFAAKEAAAGARSGP